MNENFEEKNGSDKKSSTPYTY